MRSKEKIMDRYRKSTPQKRLEMWCRFRDLRGAFDEVDDEPAAGNDHAASSLFPRPARNGNGFDPAIFGSIYRIWFGR